MATQYDPIAKDGSLNTTEATPRNIADVLAEGLKGIEDALPPTYTEGDGIDITNDEISVDTTFTEASTRANIASGESFSTILGKIKKFFTDLKTVAFTGAYSDLTGQPDLTNVAYKNADNQFSANQTIDRKNGTTITAGESYIQIGNNTAEGTDGNSYGELYLYSKSSKYAGLGARNLTGDRMIDLPDKSGTIALTSDFAYTALTGTGYTNAPSLQRGGYIRIGSMIMIFVEVAVNANSSTTVSICSVPKSIRPNEDFIGCKNSQSVAPTIIGFRIYDGKLYLNDQPTGQYYISMSGLYITSE